MRRAFTIVLRVAVGFLLAIGIVFSIQRGLSVTSADPGALVREQLKGLAEMSSLTPDSAEYARLARELPNAAANLNRRPAATLWHLVPASVFFLLVALQFSRRLRSRYPAVHRWNGRVMLAMVAISAAAGVYLGNAEPYGGVVESVATVVFGSLFVLFAVRGYLAIRRRDVARHREWMIRMFAIGLGISTIRVVGIANAMVFGTQAINPQAFALSLWIGWLLTLAAAELWIRRTRPARRVESEAALQPL